MPPQLVEPISASDIARITGRYFASMLRALVHCLDQRSEDFIKGFIAIAAPKTAGFLKIRLRKSTYRTVLGWRHLFDLLSFAHSEQKISQRKASRIRDTLFF